MSITIIVCPHCKTLLLSDTIQCPECKHTLDPSRVAQLAPYDALPSQTHLPVSEEPCTNCGELVRRGLVRCWNCSAFMRQDIADVYRKMRQDPSRVTYGAFPRDVRDAPLKDEIASTIKPEHLLTGARPDDDRAEDEEGFELSPAAAPTATADDDFEESHSIATGGDVLLQVALSEEAETEERRKVRQTAGTFRVYCPNGHRIDVRERHRGKTGRCPKCRELFSVPEKSWDETAAVAKQESQPESAEETKPSVAAAEESAVWLNDVRVHKVEPEKLKLKPGSLQNVFEPFDFGFVQTGLLAVKLLGKRATGRGAEKKNQSVREEMLTHFKEGKPLDELPVAEHHLFEPDAVRGIRVVQPAAYAHESMFAGIPVFGAGRIAVQFPPAESQTSPQFASFPLSQFREFADALADSFGVEDLGGDCGVPLTDEFTELKCHYTDQTLRVLENVEFYQADPGFEVKLVGRRCQGCQLVVSEDARKKEKIGGKTGKGIAKAKCPKCKANFGDTSLFTIKAPAEPELAPKTSPTDETPAADSQ